MKRAEKKQKVEAVTANTKSVGSFVLSSSSESQAKMTVQTQQISCNEKQEYFLDKEELITYSDHDEEKETSSLDIYSCIYYVFFIYS